MNAPQPGPSSVERLAISRERIRLSLQQAQSPAQPGGEPSPLLAALMSIPGAKIVVDGVRHWWARHPMHLAGRVAADAARTVVRPMARRSPYTLVLTSLLVGGLLFWIKPWRGLLRPALLAGLLPQIISRAIAHVPMESWLSAWMSMSSPREGAEPVPGTETRTGDGSATGTTATGTAPSPAIQPQSPTSGSVLH